MPSLPVLRTLLRELTTLERAKRVPEPDLVMDHPGKVAAYDKAGEVDGVMAPVYLFHAANVCEVIKPGDLVVDLACGPANQLAMVARLNRDVRFIGVDLSEPMLARARERVRESGLENVEFRRRDISNLRDLAECSVDAAISTMALHHLPTLEYLKATFLEIKRVLKPDGGIYIVDFGHLKAERSIQYFAHQYADRQPELFTLDYLYSLRAAFSLADFRFAGTVLKSSARLYTTFLSPFMVAFKSAVRRPTDRSLQQRFQEMRAALPQHHQQDLRDLVTFFRLGGLRCSLLQ
jgi:ubiquinone/menaquinone biosynthesis C-methylase UbiE